MFSYNEARKYIKEAMKKGSVLGLYNMHTLLDKMDNPQNKINIIHVAGTNGKGSTIAYLDSILQTASYKVGKYISPSVFSYREIMQINSENISKDEFAEILFYVSEIVKDNNIGATAFEIETAAAFEYFMRNSCDVAIIETGLGGRLDATNVIKKPLMCMITSISLDHTDVLGETIREIAGEKAGIIMEDTCVVMHNQSEEVMSVVREAAREKNSELFVTGKPYDVVFGKEITSFSYDDERYDTAMKGVFQIENAIAAIEAARILNEISTLNITGRHIYEGVKAAVWKGRFEKIAANPEVYIDGAHNPDAVGKMLRTIDENLKGEKIIFIMGVFADKDYRQSVKMCANYADMIFTITPDNKRALDGKILAEEISKYNKNVEYADSIELAVKKAHKSAREKDATIICFGSLSYLGKVRKVVNDDNRK